MFWSLLQINQEFKGKGVIIRVINSRFLGGQSRELLEYALNLDLCARQTNIRPKIPKTEYTKKVLEATGTRSPKPGTYVPGIVAKRGNLVGPRVDLRRVALSHLLEASSAYK